MRVIWDVKFLRTAAGGNNALEMVDLGVIETRYVPQVGAFLAVPDGWEEPAGTQGPLDLLYIRNVIYYPETEEDADTVVRVVTEECRNLQVRDMALRTLAGLD